MAPMEVLPEHKFPTAGLASQSVTQGLSAVCRHQACVG